MLILAPTSAQLIIKIQEKSKFHFVKILKNKWNRVKVLLSSFHLNGNTIGFHSLTQKLELRVMTFTGLLFASLGSNL